VAYGAALPLVCPRPAARTAPRSGVVRAGSRSCRVPTYGPVGHVQVGLMISRSPNALGRALGAPYVRTCEHPGADNATCGRIRRSGLDRRSSGLVTRDTAPVALYFDPQRGRAFEEPAMLRSRRGRLKTTFTVRCHILAHGPRPASPTVAPRPIGFAYRTIAPFACAAARLANPSCRFATR
jgi:hypothetical protein